MRCGVAKGGVLSGPKEHFVFDVKTNTQNSEL